MHADGYLVKCFSLKIFMIQKRKEFALKVGYVILVELAL